MVDDLLLDTLPAYIAGNIKPEPQDPSQVTFSPNIKPEEEKLDWTKSNRQLFNQIRGMNPWPVAHTFLKGDRFKIYEALPEKVREIQEKSSLSARKN